VSLHQDLSIPVKERVVSNEFSGWSEKEGCVFVQPPVSVLESLVAVRVHLDHGGAESGALRVVPGSHRFWALGVGPGGRIEDRAGRARARDPARRRIGDAAAAVARVI